MKLVMVLWVVLKFELHVCIKITEGSVCVCVWAHVNFKQLHCTVQ